MSNKTSENRTYKLDQVTTTKMAWCILALKEMGITSPAQRAILSRALDVYVDFLETLVIDFVCNPKSKDVKEELYELAKLSKERRSAWNSLELPKLDLESFGAFPKYSALAKQYYQPIKPLPKIPKPKKPKKPKNKGVSFHQLKPKAPPLPNPDSITVSPDFGLDHEPDVGKLLFNKFENQ